MGYLRIYRPSERFRPQKASVWGRSEGVGPRFYMGRPPSLPMYPVWPKSNASARMRVSLARPPSPVAKSAAHSPAECSVAHPCHMFNNKKVPSTGGLLLTHDATKQPMSTVAKRSIKKDSQEWLLTMWIRRDRDPKNWRIQDPQMASWRFGWPNWDNEIPAWKCRGWRGRRNKKCGGVKQTAEGAEMGRNGKKGWGSAVFKIIYVGWGY